jgi:hypothetical protein
VLLALYISSQLSRVYKSICYRQHECWLWRQLVALLVPAGHILCVLAMAPAYAQCCTSPAGEVCVSHDVSHVSVCVGVHIIPRRRGGAVLLSLGLRVGPLTSLDVPFGAGACTFESCRFIWCGEYRSASENRSA